MNDEYKSGNAENLPIDYRGLANKYGQVIKNSNVSKIEDLIANMYSLTESEEEKARGFAKDIFTIWQNTGENITKIIKGHEGLQNTLKNIENARISETAKLLKILLT